MSWRLFFRSSFERKPKMMDSDSLVFRVRTSAVRTSMMAGYVGFENPRTCVAYLEHDHDYNTDYCRMR